MYFTALFICFVLSIVIHRNSEQSEKLTVLLLLLLETLLQVTVIFFLGISLVMPDRFQDLVEDLKEFFSGSK
jgi:hypothetical protein